MQQRPTASEGDREMRARPRTRLKPAALVIWFAFLLCLFGLGAAAPMFSPGLSFWFYLFQWIALATGLNLMAGMTGYLPFGYVAFFGCGAYAASIMAQNYGLPVSLGIASAAVAGALLAIVFAPTLRLTGIFFSIVSLSLGIVLQHGVALLPERFAGGSIGITLTIGRNPTLYYYLMLATAAAAVLAVTAIMLSRMGLMLKAMRDDPQVARMTGINVPVLRLFAWTLSAVIAALCGAIEALYTSIIDPTSSFNVLITAKAVIYAAIGGFGTVMGPVLGAIAMTVVDEAIWARFPVANLFILGAIISMTVLFVPRGIVGALLQRNPAFRRWLF